MNRFEERLGLVKHMASGPGAGKINSCGVFGESVVEVVSQKECGLFFHFGKCCSSCCVSAPQHHCSSREAGALTSYCSGVFVGSFLFVCSPTVVSLPMPSYLLYLVQFLYSTTNNTST